MADILPREKAELRKMIRRKMREMDPAARIQADEAICRKVTELPAFREAGTVFCFVGVDWEIDTTSLINAALADGKRVTLPLCTGPGIIEARLIRSPDDLQPGAYNIPEPVPEAPVCSPEEIGFAAVPCVSCDRTCLRLGQGGGFYDRFLEKASFYTAALCREDAMLDQVPAEPWDRPVDCVVTEAAFYFRRYDGTSH